MNYKVIYYGYNSNRKKVNSGMYSNASAVVAEALGLIDKFEKAQSIKCDLLC
ncbi:hypothetical protein A1C_00945 [Rickettsia akari str. Hartford]|uniref:Uncharacterized protein n=1 Tax=Rickettsia akari (strain Hartford) TaxID=293614 RepID=A8GM94_RICAH|nr:hypothetical protein [Rickettsia akari]ABV74519.1 hypothetical protein A1C_00945 [Rickettsia akari str. Hartford]